MTRPWKLIREAIASAWSQPVASVLTVLMITGMILAVMLTTGRSAGAQQQVINSLDTSGTRSIVIKADPTAGLTSDVLDRIDRIGGVEWSAGFSAVVDSTNTLIPDGIRVPVRLVYSKHMSSLGLPEEDGSTLDSVFASDAALEQLGMPDPSGAVTTADGATYPVIGSLTAPDFLADLEPLALVPQSADAGGSPLTLVVVIARDPEVVAAVAVSVQSVLAVDDTSQISIQTSEELATLRTLIEDQLASFSRALALVMLAVSGALVAIVLYGLVMMRRRDFGRRRALGASRSLIVMLLVTQTCFLALIGAVLGTATSVIVLLASHDPMPSVTFFASVAILAVVTSLVAALVPATIASRRDPIRELRVP